MAGAFECSLCESILPIEPTTGVQVVRCIECGKTVTVTLNEADVASLHASKTFLDAAVELPVRVGDVDQFRESSAKQQAASPKDYHAEWEKYRKITGSQISLGDYAAMNAVVDEPLIARRVRLSAEWLYGVAVAALGLRILFSVLGLIGELHRGSRILWPETLIAVACHVGVNYLIMVGAMNMKTLRSYRWATVAAALASIPLISPGFIFGIPFGIWALVVLSNPGVRAEFRRNAAAIERRKAVVRQALCEPIGENGRP